VTVAPGDGVLATVVFQFNKAVAGRAAVTTLLLTVIENTADPVAARLSETWMVGVVVWATDGVPETTPVELFKVKPVGNVPDVTVQEL